MSVWITAGVVRGSELERLLHKHAQASELPYGFLGEILGWPAPGHPQDEGPDAPEPPRVDACVPPGADISLETGSFADVIYNFCRCITQPSEDNPPKKWAREGWNGKNQYITLHVPDAHSKMGLPYIYISTVQGQLVPWLASQTDMLARDWYVVK